jgi:hypothetical protein
MENLFVEPLLRKAVLNAYPFVHLAVPGLDLSAWRRFARLSLRRRRGEFAGILVAKRSARQHICGLVCYRREPDLLLGQVMQARNLISIDILDTKSIVLALMINLGSLARANGCSSVHLTMPDAEFSSSLLPRLISHLERRSEINRWVDVSFAADELSLRKMGGMQL